MSEADSHLDEFFDNLEELIGTWMDLRLRLKTEHLDVVALTSIDQKICGITIDAIVLEEGRHFVEIDLFLMKGEDVPLTLGPDESKIKEILLCMVQGQLRWSKIDFIDPVDLGVAQVVLTRNELISGLYDDADAHRINDILEEMEGEFEAVHRLVMHLLADPDQSFDLEQVRLLLTPTAGARIH